jgi:outer membrane lipoprotein-sorting protein
MTRLFRWVLLSTLLLPLFQGTVHAQEAAKIVDQYIKAVGGSKALSKIQTETLEGTFSNPADGKPSTYTFSLKLPNRYYTEFVLGDKNLIEAYNGKSAWHQTPSGELSTVLGQEGQQLEAASLYYNSRLLNLKKSKLAIALLGHAQVRGKDALQVELTTSTNIRRELFFDPQSHLLVEESGPIAGLDEEIFYDDYRAVDGVKLPYKIELHRGSDTYSIGVTQAAINGTIGERTFDFPKKSQVQLPDLKALFKEIDDNQKAADKIRENYAGTRVEEETQFEKDGKLKKTEVSEYTFFYLNGDEVSTLVKKDGKALSDAEQQKENEKTQKEIAEIQKREAKKEAKEEKAKEEGKDKKDKDDDDVGIETFLRACQFVNPRRERFRGQDVLVFDFEPNPEFQPHKMVEKIVHELAGVVWVDEKAHEVARLEGYFVGDFHVAGGLLANLQKGTSFVFEQSYFNNEVWLPTYEEAHVGVRVLLMKGFNVNAVTRYSDYKRFNVETLATIGKPKGAEDQPTEKPRD